MRVISSWSGGKESCLSCWKAIQKGYGVSFILNFISEEFKRVSFHGVEAGLIQKQVSGTGISLVQKETTPDGYENEFKDAVAELIPSGIEGMVFGDIYLQEHRDWVERVCSDLSIEAIEPLWGRKPENVFREFLQEGFNAVVVCVNPKFIDKSWVGKELNLEFLDYLLENGIEPCGENGEYHTLVTAGPLFEKKIEIQRSEIVEINNYFFLDIQDCGVI